MANLNEVSLQIKVQGEKEATAALKRFNSEQGKLSTSVLDSGRKMESINSRWKEADRLLAKGTLSTKAHTAAQTQLGRELAALNGMYDSAGRLLTRKATQQLRDQQATNQAAQSQANFNQRMEELKMRLDPAYRASVQFKNSLEELNAVYAAGAIGVSVYEDQMGLLERQMDLVSQGGRGQRRSMNNMNIAVQQAGYQVSDFAIQVQGGTSAFVAFSQQASQLVGILPLVSTSLGMSAGMAVALSSGLAIAIPLITVAANVFFEMSKEAKESEAKISDLEDGLKSLDSTMQTWLRTREAATKGVTVEELLGIEGAESAVQRLEKERQAIVDAIQAQLPGVDLSDYSREMASILSSSSQYADVLGSLIEAETRLANIRRKQGEEQFAAFSENIRSLQQQIDMEKEIAQFGANSSQVRRLELEQEIANRKEAIDQQVKAKEITIAQGIAQKKLTEEALRLADANESSGYAAQKLSDIFESMSMDNILSQMDTLNSQLGSAIFGAGTLSARLSGVFAAGVAAAERVKIQQDQQRARSEGFRFDSTKQNGGISKTEAFFTGQVGFSNAPRTPDGLMGVANVKSGGGGGGRKSKTEEDYLAQLEAEATFKRTLIGLTDEQTIVEERRRDIIERLTKDGDKLSETERERIEKLIQLEAGTRSLIEAEKQREQMIQTVESNIESAFMSVVDGSKTVEEAFKGMMRNILLEVYKSQIAKPAATGIGNLISRILGQADGGAWNRGVQMFANGGVVNGPTAFGHSGGLGIMGEAGPEAIMPLKRGRGGKLGVATEPQQVAVDVRVSVDQSGNLRAFVDQRADARIGSAVPSIAQYTTKTIVDERRKGGSMKAAFRG